MPRLANLDRGGSTRAIAVVQQQAVGIVVDDPVGDIVRCGTFVITLLRERARRLPNSSEDPILELDGVVHRGKRNCIHIVGAERAVEQDGVCPSATMESESLPGPAIEHVVTCGPYQQVIAAAAIENVVPTGTV